MPDRVLKVENVYCLHAIASMEANHLHPTIQKSIYVEISHIRHHAELVTDDRNTIHER